MNVRHRYVSNYSNFMRSTVAQEIRAIIVRHVVYHTTRAQVLQLQFLERSLEPLIRQYIYRHVNIRTLNDMIAFAITLGRHADLCQSVRSPQLSLDLDTLDPEQLETFSQSWISTFPNMTNLVSINLCYSHEDSNALQRFVNFHHFPRSLAKLHLKPLWDEMTFQVRSQFHML